jgi:hypothetical protein
MADSQPIFVQSTNPRGLGQRTPIPSNVYAIPTDTKSHSTDISTDKKLEKFINSKTIVSTDPNPESLLYL